MISTLVFRLTVIVVGVTFGLQGQPLNERVLVVHNTTSPDSLEVAQHYMTQRGIPSANLCAITAPVVETTNYAAEVRNPIRACVNAIGAAKILYIVMAYNTPYNLFTSNRWYAVDSYLSDLWDQYSVLDAEIPNAPHGYYADNQTSGNSFAPFVSLASYRTAPKATRLYAVWRLDAPTKLLAKALVDRAITAEQTTRTGIGCFDARLSAVNTGDNGYGLGEWDVYKAREFASAAGFTTILDENYEEFGTAPAPLRCDNALLYAGWYSFNNYNDVFQWNPGAIGWHLDSFSAGDPRGGPNWSANAIQRGITITSGATQEPYVTGLPRAAGVFRNLFEGANVGDAFLRNTRWLKWRVHNLGDPLYRPFPGGLPPFNTNTPTTSFRVNPKEMVRAGNVTGTIQLANVAPSGGTSINLSLSVWPPAAVTVPPSVTVPAGSRSVSFNIAVPLATGDLTTSVGVTASGPGFTLSNNTFVYPYLGAVRLDVATVRGGNPTIGRVLLNERAPLGGMVVNLSTDNAAASVPAIVLVPAGETQVSFAVTTTAVGANTPVTIKATQNGTEKTAVLTVTP